MNLDFASWRTFTIGSVFTIFNGRGITLSEVEENPGTLNAVQSGEENNGVIGKISVRYCRENDYVFTERPCLTVARTGSAGFVSFQTDGCVVGDSAKILQLRYENGSTAVYLFLQTILNENRFKFSYGRKVTEEKYLGDTIDLPVETDKSGRPVIDPKGTYSPDGYMPDWQYMEYFIQSLNHKPLTTANSTHSVPLLDVSHWTSFHLRDLCEIDMGNKMDFSAMSVEDPNINFVGRSSVNNGVMGRVDEQPGVVPYPAGSLTVALGGSLGSTYVQVEPFYTSQNVAVLQFDDTLVSLKARLFLANIIQFESRFKYFPFGRELNKYIRTTYGFDLPIQRDVGGEPIIDDSLEFHPEGYVPDWQFMEDYIKSLPYGDRIPEIESEEGGGDQP